MCEAYAEYRKLFDDSKVMHREIPVKIKKNCLLFTLKGLTTFKTTVLVTMQVTRTRAATRCLPSLCTHLERIYTQPGRYGLCHSCCRNHIHLDLSHTRVRSSCKPTDSCNPVFENYGLFANEIHVHSGRPLLFSSGIPSQNSGDLGNTAGNTLSGHSRNIFVDKCQRFGGTCCQGTKCRRA